MLKFNFIYELKQLLRSRWIQLLSILLLLLFGFATHNGLEKVDRRQTTIEDAESEMQKLDEQMVKLLDSLEKGFSVSISTGYYPSRPMVIGNLYPRVATMPANDFTFIATGQSDMYTHYKKPQVSSSSYIDDYTEMTSPVQLLFGSFDLAFIIVYLLPLLIIAFSYNVLSAQKESGSLKVLASQPIQLEVWVMQKLGLRFFWLSILVIVSMSLVFMIFGVNFSLRLSIFFRLIGLILAYMLFWFAVAFVINLWIGSSAKNAVSLLGVWIVFVLLVPSVLNQLSAVIYPTPSRTLLINEVRTLQADATKRQDEILDNFLRNHPEYALRDSTQQRNFYHGYLASQKLVRDELRPILNNYEQQLQGQRSWVTQFKWFSPAIVTQEALNQIAGTSTQDYENYRQQVISFTEKWRAYFLPFVYSNTKFKKADVVNLPTFNYEQQERSSNAGLMIILISIGLIGIGIGIANKRKYNLIID